MEINPYTLNKGKLTHLLAKDLFSEDIKQVFHAKTGKYLGYIKDGLTILSEEQPEELQPEEIKNNNQLKLF